MVSSAASKQDERDPQYIKSRDYLMDMFPLQDPARMFVYRMHTRPWIGKAVVKLALNTREVDDPSRLGQRLLIIGYSDSVVRRKAEEVASGNWDAKEAI